ncbi:MAG: VWA domain-containing protein, partial [Candidatus Krumholzibacteria bacterium]|nr:VWA domain-containing protein [Candidatus Krumholzibacteria bacterium]
GKTGYCGYEGKNVLPDRDFLLYYTLSEKDMGLNLLTHKPYGKNGYFMLLLSPGRLERTGAVISKEIVFVIDVSGSMAGEKIEQAKEALKYCLRKLNRGDRFNIITFATGIEYFQEGPVPAAMKMIDLALDFVDTIDARGGTNIDEALRKALSAAESPGAPRMIIFLTDGAPTVGETDDDDILKNVKKRNSKDARIFSFGVGYDVNTYLLDNLSLGNGGMAEYIKPEESIELKVTSFFSKVSDPIMTDISLEFDRVRIRDLYPTELPDIFNGMQLVLFGRYRDSGPTAIHLRGRVGENDKTMMFESSFDETNRGNDFIPRLWATRKIAYLLTEVRLHGESNELVGEIINLAKEHGIITPYTSYLIHKHGPPTIRPLMSRAMLNDQHDIAGKGLKKRTGVEAFRMSRNVGRDRESSTLSSPTSDSVVYVGRKTFYLTGDGWIDEEYAEGSDVVDLEFMSEKYLELLGTNPEIGDYLSIGTNVTFVFQGKCYRVRE